MNILKKQLFITAFTLALVPSIARAAIRKCFRAVEKLSVPTQVWHVPVTPAGRNALKEHDEVVRKGILHGPALWSEENSCFVVFAGDTHFKAIGTFIRKDTLSLRVPPGRLWYQMKDIDTSHVAFVNPREKASLERNDALHHELNMIHFRTSMRALRNPEKGSIISFFNYDRTGPLASTIFALRKYFIDRRSPEYRHFTQDSRIICDPALAPVDLWDTWYHGLREWGWRPDKNDIHAEWRAGRKVLQDNPHLVPCLGGFKGVKELALVRGLRSTYDKRKGVKQNESQTIMNPEKLG